MDTGPMVSVDPLQHLHVVAHRLFTPGATLTIAPPVPPDPFLGNTCISPL